MHVYHPLSYFNLFVPASYIYPSAIKDYMWESKDVNQKLNVE
ncbi:hypothetical protein T11_3016 [Trichinella zimbabwensis]|uniref:Uncharacterized protein n=1 Tax=Trichinella zimbabwensis TaxID=268475 RepID=A0A0V1GGB8_9BILA|nr:hypothetical protein T11_11944 [Trichinella zimbabwensis]KRY97313.1 hypothetical protein T11_3016 [Trichinella zimbabwensis]